MKIFYVLLVGVIPIIGARADDAAPGRLTLGTAVAEALAHNPSIAEAAATWDAARERVIQEGAWEDLQVSAMSRAGRFVDVARNAFPDQTVSMSQIVPISGRNVSRARAAAAEALMAYEDMRRRQLDTVSQVRTAYYRLANARAQVELNRENLALLKQMSEVSRTRYETGGQTLGEVLGAETEEGKQLEVARDLERGVEAEETALNVAMGRDAFSPMGVLDNAETMATDIAASVPKELPEDRLLAVMLENRPEIRSAEDALEAARARLELAHRAWIPDPALTVEGQRYNAAGQGVSEVDAGISFNIPWSNERKYAAGTREAAANVEAAERALEGRKQEALGLLRMALADVATSQHHLHLSGEVLLKQAQAGLTASGSEYEAGKAGLGDWLAAERAVEDVKGMRLEERRNYETAMAELEAVIGATVFNNPSKN